MQCSPPHTDIKSTNSSSNSNKNNNSTGDNTSVVLSPQALYYVLAFTPDSPFFADTNRYLRRRPPPLAGNSDSAGCGSKTSDTHATTKNASSLVDNRNNNNNINIHINVSNDEQNACESLGETPCAATLALSAASPICRYALYTSPCGFRSRGGASAFVDRQGSATSVTMQREAALKKRRAAAEEKKRKKKEEEEGAGDERRRKNASHTAHASGTCGGDKEERMFAPFVGISASKFAAPSALLSDELFVARLTVEAPTHAYAFGGYEGGGAANTSLWPWTQHPWIPPLRRRMWTCNNSNNNNNKSDGNEGESVVAVDYLEDEAEEEEFGGSFTLEISLRPEQHSSINNATTTTTNNNNSNAVRIDGVSKLPSDRDGVGSSPHFPSASSYSLAPYEWWLLSPRMCPRRRRANASSSFLPNTTTNHNNNNNNNSNNESPQECALGPTAGRWHLHLRGSPSAGPRLQDLFPTLAALYRRLRSHDTSRRRYGVKERTVGTAAAATVAARSFLVEDRNSNDDTGKKRFLLCPQPSAPTDKPSLKAPDTPPPPPPPPFGVVVTAAAAAAKSTTALSPPPAAAAASLPTTAYANMQLPELSLSVPADHLTELEWLGGGGGGGGWPGALQALSLRWCGSISDYNGLWEACDVSLRGPDKCAKEDMEVARRESSEEEEDAADDEGVMGVSAATAAAASGAAVHVNEAKGANDAPQKQQKQLKEQKQLVQQQQQQRQRQQQRRPSGLRSLALEGPCELAGAYAAHSRYQLPSRFYKLGAAESEGSNSSEDDAESMAAMTALALPLPPLLSPSSSSPSSDGVCGGGENDGGSNGSTTAAKKPANKKKKSTEMKSSALPRADLSGIESLAIYRWSLLSDASAIGVSFPLLRCLDLGHTGITSIQFLKHLPLLSRLRLSGCDQITDFTPLASLPELRHVDLEETCITAGGLACLTGVAAQLISLSLRRCRRIEHVERAPPRAGPPPPPAAVPPLWRGDTSNGGGAAAARAAAGGGSSRNSVGQASAEGGLSAAQRELVDSIRAALANSAAGGSRVPPRNGSNITDAVAPNANNNSSSSRGNTATAAVSGRHRHHSPPPRESPQLLQEGEEKEGVKEEEEVAPVIGFPAVFDYVAGALEVVDVSYTAISDLSWLRGCRQLRSAALQSVGAAVDWPLAFGLSDATEQQQWEGEEGDSHPVETATDVGKNKYIVGATFNDGFPSGERYNYYNSSNSSKHAQPAYPLESLRLWGAATLTNVHFLHRYPFLRQLCLCRCKGITDWSAFTPGNTSRIEDLDLSYTNFTDASLLLTMPSLVRLSVHGCTQLFSKPSVAAAARGAEGDSGAGAGSPHLPTWEEQLRRRGVMVIKDFSGAFVC